MKRHGVGGSWLARELRDTAQPEQPDSAVRSLAETISLPASGPLIQRLGADSLASLAWFSGLNVQDFLERYDFSSQG